MAAPQEERSAVLDAIWKEARLLCFETAKASVERVMLLAILCLRSALHFSVLAESCRLGAKPVKLQGGGAKGGYYVFVPGDGEQLTTPRRTPFLALVSFETLAVVRHV